jgi:hypothetical protein
VENKTAGWYGSKYSEVFQTKVNELWSQPQVGWLKVNVDDAFDGDSGTGGVGKMIRDHQGSVVISSWSWIRQATRPVQVVALATIRQSDNSELPQKLSGTLF